MSTTDYGVCKDCEAPMPTEADANAHMAETRPPGMVVGSKSHAISVLNPTPEQVARREVAWAIERAAEAFCEDIYGEVEGGRLTVGQVTDALAWHSDFAEAWAEYVEDVA